MLGCFSSFSEISGKLSKLIKIYVTEAEMFILWMKVLLLQSAQTYFYAKTCSARLGLDWTGWGIKGFATLATLSSFLV